MMLQRRSCTILLAPLIAFLVGCTGGFEAIAPTEVSSQSNTPPPPVPLKVNSVSPTELPLSGGMITISGEGFEAGITVTFGSENCGSLQVVSATTLTCMAPASTTAGSKTIIVQRADGSGATSSATTEMTVTLPTSRTCTVTGGTGMQDLIPGTSNYGPCVATSCSSGYNLVNGACVAMACTPNSQTSCPIANGTGSQTCKADGTGYGSCALTNCNPGYDRVNNTCVRSVVAMILGGAEAAGSVHMPSGIARNSAGDIFIADTGNDRVQKYNSAGKYLGQIGVASDETGLKLPMPWAIAVDSSDNILVASGNKIKKVSASGNLLLEFGSFNFTAKLMFGESGGLAIDAQGNIYVSDGGNNRVQKFSPTGQLLMTFGSEGSGNGQLKFPMGIAIEASGRLLVSDNGNSRVQVFSPAGDYIAQFNKSGPGGTVTMKPEGIAIDPSGKIWVADALHGTIELYSATYAHINSLDADPGTNGLTMGAVSGMIFDSAGSIYLTDSSKNHMMKYDSNLALLKFGLGYADGEFDRPSHVVVDSAKNIYVVDDKNYRVQVFSPSGAFKFKFGAWGNGSGQWGQVTDMAIDSSGRIYLATINPGNTCRVDSPYSRIQVFSPAGAYLHSIGGVACGSPEIWYTELAVTSNGTVYTTNALDQIIKFSSTGQELSRFGSSGTAVGQFSSIMGMDVDASGNLYVSDNGNSGRLTKYGPSGNIITTMNLIYSGDIAIDSANNIYVGGYGSDLVRKFSPAGVQLGSVGGAGYRPGKFHWLPGIAIDSDNAVYAVDAGNSRVQKLNSF